jgi:hypothetical protein
MDTIRIGWGIVAMFLGIIVPVMHHVLVYWPVADQPTTNIAHRFQDIFIALPWIDWVYLVAMTIVGMVLIVSGMRGGRKEG